MKYGFLHTAAVSPALHVADCAYNTQQIIAAMRAQAVAGTKLLCLPEFTLTGYTCSDLFLQETLCRGAEDGLIQILDASKELDVVALVGLPVRHNGKLYNCAAVVCKGQLLGLVPKTYLPNYGEFYERRHFVPGPKDAFEITFAGQRTLFGTNLLFACREMPEFVLGVEICEDLWAPVPPSCSHALAGATVVANLSASDETVGKAAYRRELVAGQSARLLCGYVYADAGHGESTTDMTFAAHNLIAENGTVCCCLYRKSEECRMYMNDGNKTKINLRNKSVFITGVAGFIGSNLAKRLLSTVEGVKVVGLDNMNHYYDVRLKEARLNELEQFDNFSFVKGNLADKAVIESIFEQYKPEIVVNLGAQAGVRYSITNPDAYVEANLIGFYNILEACRHSYDEGHTPVEHLVYATSSSVYGSNKKVPYSTDDKVDNPVSLYAATKKSNELMAHAYSKLYNIPSTGLRFFTVYGPAGRPDMAYFGFTNKLLKGETIQIFNYGNCKRDFTYVDDIVEGVVRVMQGAPERKNGEDGLPVPPYAVYNIGNQNPENLLDFVQILQEELIRAGVLPEDYDFEAHKKLVPMQPGDVPVTYADTSALERDFGYKPSTSLREGLRKFAEWYAKFYK